MAWKINLKFGEQIEINGAVMTFDRNVCLILHNQSHVVLPSGKIVEPKKDD